MIKKRKIIIIVALVCFLSLFLTACQDNIPQTAVIRLNSAPSTGFEWTVTQDPEIFDVTKEYIPETKEKKGSGAGGTDVITLTPKKSGKTDVTFCYEQTEKNMHKSIGITYTIKVTNDMQINVKSATADVNGSISAIPEIPDFETR